MRLRMLSFAFAAGVACADEKPAYTFGTTVVDSSGLQGRIYHLEPDTLKLPKLHRMQPVGTVYTTSLNIWPQRFDEGFPSISDRFEWFAISYAGKIWIESPGEYRFSVLADDGARLYINDKLVVDNDGIHGAQAISASASLTRGVFDIRIDYFQG
ncbi:MAG TPA: PA14 domain-containing protein, partial [Bryobacteraceae bacterium]|nr:PA14 domain-containing protein [Bryobacteraceae bacterium]